VKGLPFGLQRLLDTKRRASGVRLQSCFEQLHGDPFTRKSAEADEKNLSKLLYNAFRELARAAAFLDCKDYSTPSAGRAACVYSHVSSNCTEKSTTVEPAPVGGCCEADLARCSERYRLRGGRDCS
jgi:hypothetical protein